ncbi:phage major capsid protein [Mycobacterium heckeshornense]|uniref:Phage capsid-like C-terminal domain-containing protein n=1 Tax=Mycobacterium heckeshornense TaxID=110505 RepID=A0A2G8B4D1_9MYCO|nr:phage major capsid protein [Mycobacterium heckeshornense]MCV7034191.1 phage major capsid protein [Mycobacterium heckeshornense]PIJ32603.1 phage major capsid protein [Mycobacterium heckeshornense]BCO36852.1 hypothetical protein MHEC_32850 [Mycobacterium heckeshornense]
MSATTATFGPILAQEQIGDLIIRPLIEQSIAGQTLTTVFTDRHEYRIPIVTNDPQASWVAEGQEITVSDAAVDELLVEPSKLAALSVISRELANDSSPAAADTIGQGIVRDLVRRTDQALFAATTPNGPTGLAGQSGITEIIAGTTYTNSDPFSDAIYLSAQHNGQITAFATSPATAMTLAKLKVGDTFNLPLLGPDPTSPGQRQILGVPLLVTPYIDDTDNTVWAIPQTQCFMVVREQAEIETDASVFFTSDRIAIRGIVRLGFGFPNPAAIVKIHTT